MGKREERREARRAAILEAGLQLVLEDGYERASVERIAAKVGIARGTFYLYFEDKEALFRALAERLYQPMVQVLEETATALRGAPDLGTHQLLYLQMSARLAAVVEEKEAAALWRISAGFKGSMPPANGVWCGPSVPAVLSSSSSSYVFIFTSSYLQL